MTTKDVQAVLTGIVLGVFENMYFMFPEPLSADDPLPTFPESCFRARIAVKNGLPEIVLYGSAQLVSNMAGNFLGSAEGLGESDLIDIFKEAANVIAGNLMTSLALDSSLGLDVPVAERMQACSELQTAPGVVFNIDNEFLKVTVVDSSG